MDKKAYTNRYNNVYKVQVVKQHKKININFTSIPLVYDTAEGNAGYQELGQLSGPYLYNQLYMIHVKLS